MWKDYLKKSRSSLEAAERDLHAQAYDPCASRAYYAVFQAAIAALIALSDLEKRGKFWEHGHIASEFTRRLITILGFSVEKLQNGACPGRDNSFRR